MVISETQGIELCNDYHCVMTPLMNFLHIIADVHIVRLDLLQAHRHDFHPLPSIQIFITIQTSTHQHTSSYTQLPFSFSIALLQSVLSFSSHVQSFTSYPNSHCTTSVCNHPVHVSNPPSLSTHQSSKCRGRCVWLNTE